MDFIYKMVRMEIASPAAMAPSFFREMYWWLELSISKSMTVAMCSNEPMAKPNMPDWSPGGIKAMPANIAPNGDMAANTTKHSHTIRFFSFDISSIITKAKAAGIWCSTMPNRK